MPRTRYTIEDFLAKAKDLPHYNDYTYDKVNYQGSKKKIIITCPTHGDFEQTPENFYRASGGCKLCSGYKYDTASFIAKAKTIWNDTIDYGQVEYVDRDEPVKLTCIKHNLTYLQKAKNHIDNRGYNGCDLCSLDNDNSKKVIDMYPEILAFIVMPNDAVVTDYNDLLIGSHTKITWKCPRNPDHIWEQRVENHVQNCLRHKTFSYCNICKQ